MNEEEFSSDASDEDFVPEGLDADLPSEEDSDGEPDDLVTDENETKSSKKRTRNLEKNKKSKRLKSEEVEQSDNEERAETTHVNPEDEKKKADSLWADFLKDTDVKPKPKATERKTDSSEAQCSSVIKAAAPEKKVTVTNVYEFAGEEVRVSREVPVAAAGPSVARRSRGSSGAGGKGLASVLGQLGKKQKISTLEKSKLDWDRFKKDEDIESELQAHNKGKHGYLERQDFLQRADLRQFELEKEIRASHRSHRLS